MTPFTPPSELQLWTQLPFPGSACLFILPASTMFGGRIHTICPTRCKNQFPCTRIYKTANGTARSKNSVSLDAVTALEVANEPLNVKTCFVFKTDQKRTANRCELHFREVSPVLASLSCIGVCAHTSHRSPYLGWRQLRTRDSRVRLHPSIVRATRDNHASLMLPMLLSGKGGSSGLFHRYLPTVSVRVHGRTPAQPVGNAERSQTSLSVPNLYTLLCHIISCLPMGN